MKTDAILSRLAQLAGNAAGDDAVALWRAWDTLAQLWRTPRVLAWKLVPAGDPFDLYVNVQRDCVIRAGDLVVRVTDPSSSSVVYPLALLELSRGVAARPFYPLDDDARIEVRCGNVLWAKGKSHAATAVVVSMHILRGLDLEEGLTPG